MKIAVISANLGNYDKPYPWADQILPEGVECDIYRLDNSNFPPRPKAMTPALQVGIAKWFAHDLYPGYDLYMWVDASCALTRGNEVSLWALSLGNTDIALFKHPARKNVNEEYEFVRDKMIAGNKYLVSRYEGEWWDEEFKYIAARRGGWADLYASTAFMYRPAERVKEAFREVFSLKVRFHLHDQIALAYALQEHQVNITRINENYQKSGYLEFVRGKK